MKRDLAEKQSILIVDDKEENLIALQATLGDMGIDIITALSGEEALQKSALYSFTLILLDVQMPGMDGFETAHILSSMKKTRDIPIIFVTAIDKSDKFVLKGYQEGAVDYLFKPIKPAILKSKIQIFLQLEQQKIRLHEQANELEIKVKQRTHELSLSEQRLRLYRQQSPIAMIEWNVNGQVVDWNKEAEHIFGYSKEDVKGKSFLDILSTKKNHQSATNSWNELISETGEKVSVSQNLTKESHVISCEWHNIPLKDEDGSIIGVASQVLDITERLRIDAVLQTLAETKGQDNEDIFQMIVRQLAQSQGVRCAYISQFNSKNSDIADTLAIWTTDGFIDNFSYPLNGTASEKVIEKETCLYINNVQTLFPKDELLVKLKAVSCFSLLLKSNGGKPLGILSMVDDKSIEKQVSTSKIINSLAVRSATELERKQADEKLQFAARIFAETHEGILITDAHATIVDINPGFCKITGYSREESIGRKTDFLSSDKQNKELHSQMWATLKEKGYWQGEIWNRSKSGSMFAEHLTISALVDDNNDVINYVGLFSDITVAKKQQQAIERMAHYDMLTGLPNRILFADRFSHAIAHSQRDKSLLAVCFIDLDEFKPVNDTHGHEAGDKVLVEVAQRIKEIIREQDTASRLGGDEFALLLGDIFSIAQCEQAMERIHQAIAQPYLIEGNEIIIAASSGITIYPNDNATPDTLLRHADLAMYQAKLSGRNRYHFFDAPNAKEVIKQHETLSEIESAFSKNEFCLYYQPKINMRTGKVYGAEALIRWIHPEKGLIPPLDFLPFIEGTELEIIVGNWVIEQALKQVDSWRETGIILTVSVNISSLHLQWQDFYQHIDQVLAKHPKILSSQVQLEILESSVLGDITTISDIIKNCQKKLGVSIALDDFGTGYSSLTHLRRIPADTIKIDQSFVRDMLIDESDYAIVEGITLLAKAFNRKVIAEGVETKEHGLKLLELGCIYAQGYGIARPMPANDLSQWLDQYQPFSEWIAYQQ